jgi:hypothetical protein
LRSAAEIAIVFTPMPFSISTLRRRFSAYCGLTTFTKPVWVKTAGPRMISAQCLKMGKLAHASRASSSLV